MSLCQTQNEYVFHVSTLLAMVSDDASDANLMELISLHPSINGCSEDEKRIIGVALSKMCRRELFGTHWRKHHATTAIDDGDPISILRHIGRMYRIGYMKYIDVKIASILENSDQLSERYIMFSFLNWIVQNRPLAKVKFKLAHIPGRSNYRDKVRNGEVMRQE